MQSPWIRGIGLRLVVLLPIFLVTAGIAAVVDCNYKMDEDDDCPGKRTFKKCSGGKKACAKRTKIEIYSGRFTCVSSGGAKLNCVKRVDVTGDYAEKICWAESTCHIVKKQCVPNTDDVDYYYAYLRYTDVCKEKPKDKDTKKDK